MDTNITHMESDESNGKPVFGQAMQAAMAKKGCELTLEESQQFTRTLLRLFELGALVFYDAEGNAIRTDALHDSKDKS